MSAPHFLSPLLKKSATDFALWANDRPRPIVTTLRCAFDSASRRRGLLDDAGLAEDTALIIAPCSAVHMFGMRFPIDVIYTDREGSVLKLVENLKPGQISATLRAFAVIEVAAGTVTRLKLSRGLRLSVRPNQALA
jgi:uncharacterized membrane protein (UPF0127 family)